jgi:hypothetical protein
MPEPTPLAEWVRVSVGIPDRLWGSLQTDDDWTFVIKIHGLIEATLNQLLLNELGNPALHTFISRLATADERTGKLAMVKACALLDKNAWAFIRALSVLRNKLVHNIKNFDLKIPEYAEELKGGDGRDWRNGLKTGISELSNMLGRPVDEYIKDEPRTAIKIACFQIMRAVFLHSERAQPLPDQSTPTK